VSVNKIFKGKEFNVVLSELMLFKPDSDKMYELKITEKRKKRSLDANAYYWVLVGKLAKKLNISSARLHNLLLRDCGLPFLIDGHVSMQPIPDTEAAEEQVLESSTYHLKPTSGVIEGKDGIYRWYIVLRGSSSYNKEEFSGLLNRLLEECQAQDIETMTPEQLQRMGIENAQKN
jgi:hypothetical protein